MNTEFSRQNFEKIINQILRQSV